MKIVVVGLGYVGLSMAVLLGRENDVVAVDIDEQKLACVRARTSPVDDREIEFHMQNYTLNIAISNDISNELNSADFVIVATPTNYCEKTQRFDTSSVESVINIIAKSGKDIPIVIKSTIPVGFTDSMKRKYSYKSILFSPEFLREGQALRDNLYPSRIIVGGTGKYANDFAELLAGAALTDNFEIILTGTREAEATKLFSNTYLAMRVAFFNELDNYALSNDLDASSIIRGISSDSRIGNYYNNPSFGYGGYCLPKDTKQLKSTFADVPQTLIDATISSNELRKEFILERILGFGVDRIGVHKLAMKHGSDNYRQSAVIDIIQRLRENGKELLIFEENFGSDTFEGVRVTNSLTELKAFSELILCNRLSDSLLDVKDKLFTRDVFNAD